MLVTDRKFWAGLLVLAVVALGITHPFVLIVLAVLALVLVAADI